MLVSTNSIKNSATVCGVQINAHTNVLLSDLLLTVHLSNWNIKEAKTIKVKNYFKRQF